jgi:hypothetical protein
MKRKTLLFITILVLISVNGLYSQSGSYKPFPIIYGSWIVKEQSSILYSSTAYEAIGDTNIGSYVYKKVSVAYSPNGSYGPKSFIFGYRNDITNKKVYIYTKIDGLFKDTLWYDFNLTIGDTIKESYSSNNDESQVHDGNYYDRRIIKSIDSVLICNEYYKRFNFCGNNGGIYTGLVEGFGFEDNFVKIGYTFSCSFIEILHTYHTLFSCALSINEEETSKTKLILFPNPVLRNMQFKFSNHNIAFPCNYSILDYLGKIILEGVAIENSNIDVSGIQNGLYFLFVQDKQKKLFQSKLLKQ